VDQGTARSGKLKEIDPLALPHIDDVVVELHTEGESVWQAFARALDVEDVTADHAALFSTLWETGQVLLESGKTSELPRLTAAEVAKICTFELESADYDADRVLLEEPLVPEPQVPVTDLWPALRRNGYRTGRDPARWHDDYTPITRLAELTGVPAATIRRVSREAGTTVGAETAFRLLRELDDEQARELEDEIYEPWLCARGDIDRAGVELEYLDALARFARAHASTGWTTHERQALEDIVWLSTAAQRKSLLGTTAAVRLKETRAAFRAVHGRDPLPLTPRLREDARRMFGEEAASADVRARGLRRGLHKRGNSITPETVAMRTHRLRRAGRLPKNSRPRRYVSPSTQHPSAA
jgi:hypothetical protein